MSDPKELLAHFKLDGLSGELKIKSPIDGEDIASTNQIQAMDATRISDRAKEAFLEWRKVPAPVRGEFVRLLGEALREHKEELGRLVTLENGKILSEGLGEVQEMIDICDLAVGQSRQLYGLTIASERACHHMREVWHPIGPVLVISAFNFPVAVWSWNAALAFICGNPVVWKPSEKTPLTALAVKYIVEQAAERYRAAGYEMPENLLQVCVGGADLGQALSESEAFGLVSATGSTAMGRKVQKTVSEHLGRTLLELGGNNAMIVTASADLEMAVRAITFGAVGTCGQRCTSLRRLILHKDIYDTLLEKLIKIYGSLKIGDPMKEGTLVGPLIDEDAFENMQNALKQARSEGGDVLAGGKRITKGVPEGGFYVEPALVEMPGQTDIVMKETFAPILYAMKYAELDQAIQIHNEVAQGLSSCIFTENVKEAEYFLSAQGSDCGIANVNIGPSGAEIGGAFGGEKETGGGRESGSDSWKSYMRRQTQTVNYSDQMPLAQGVKFDV